MDLRFSLFPLERIARNWPGVYDENFDDSQLPFEVIKGVYVENVSDRIPKDEFDYCNSALGSETVKHLQKVSYAIIHRFPNIDYDPATGKYLLEAELSERSRELIQTIVACLRIIRPTAEHAQFMGGEVSRDGKLRHFHFDNPYTFVQSVPNQQLFAIRTSDLEALRQYAPLFIEAITGQYWKYIMAVDMFQSGFFQHSHWKLRFFMWTAALEALFTSHTSAEHRGSLVAKERIKWLLGENTLIYPPGELTEFDNDPKLTVGGVIDEIYCLRNHIAHGDKVPNYYFTAQGRTRDDGTVFPRGDILMEATSSIVRQSLLLILKNGLLPHFRDSAASERYFKGHTKNILAKSGQSHFKCPE